MTQTLIKKKDNGPVVCFSLVQAGFWMSFCISVSFASVYLQAIGCSNSLLGLILALGNLSGVVLALCICAIAFVLKTFAFIMFLGIRNKERQTDQKRSDMI